MEYDKHAVVQHFVRCTWKGLEFLQASRNQASGDGKLAQNLWKQV